MNTFPADTTEKLAEAIAATTSRTRYKELIRDTKTWTKETTLDDDDQRVMRCVKSYDSGPQSSKTEGCNTFRTLTGRY